MKKVVLAAVLILLVMTGRSQSFEGTIHWNMKMEVTDPKAKAQMEQMAKVLGNKGANGMMPTGITIKLKGGNSLAKVEGGIMDNNDVLYNADKKMSYTIMHGKKTYIQVPANSSQEDPRKPKITKTSETAKILNYTCTKYIAEFTGPDGKAATTNYWATDEIKDIDLKALAKQTSMTKGQGLIISEIEGVPLKIEMSTPQGNVTMEVTEIKRGSLPASDFSVPAGYTETKI